MINTDLYDHVTSLLPATNLKDSPKICHKLTPYPLQYVP